MIKAYNDVYGFEKGNLVRKLLSDILRNYVSNEQFIGHIGGDDFVAILNEHITEDYFRDMVNQFEIETLSFYNQTDIQNGYITTTNRHNEEEKFPLTTLTSVVVNNRTRTFDNVFELTEMLAELKKIAKQSKTIKIKR